jgi:hypothetical protein
LADALNTVLDDWCIVDVSHLNYLCLKMHWNVTFDARGNQILEYFLLAIDSDASPSSQLIKWYSEPRFIKRQNHSFMLEALPIQPPGDIQLAKEVHRVLLQQSGAHPGLNIIPAPGFKNYTFNTLSIQ